MSKQAQLHDGTILEFPDDTPDSVMDGAVKKHLQANWKPQRRTAADLKERADFYRAGHNEAAGDNSFGKNLVLGVGKSLVDTGRGFKQLVGMAGEQDVDRAREVDRDLMGTVGGNIGNVGGTALQIISPGVALKAASRARHVGAAAGKVLNTTSRAFLPTTIRGGAAQGAVVGGLQGVGSGDSRGLQALAGAGFGAAGAAIPAAAGGLLRLARGVPASASGTETRIAQILRSEAENPAGLMTQEPSLVSGVQRTLAEETRDPGIARLERYARGMGNGFEPLDRANNAARVNALAQFGGDPAAIKAAKAARDSVATPLRRQAMQDTGVDMAPIQQAIDSGIAKNATRSSVRRAIQDVESELANADGSVASLYGVRKSIDDLLSGKAGSDKAYAKAASAELQDIKRVLDKQIAAKSPAFRQYLDAFRDGSKAVDRMKVGQRLINAGGVVPDAKTGLRNLTPGAFSRATSDLDAVAAKATGFRKAQAADILQPQDFATIANVQDDLQRVGFAATAGSGKGSPTQPLQQLNERVAGGLAGRIPLVGQAYRYLAEVGQQRLQARLTEVLANPAQARAVLAKVPANDRRVLETALTRAGIAFAPAAGQRLTE